MMDYLQPFDGPVFPGRIDDCEVVYAKDQPEYIPLRCSIEDPDGERRATSRWTLTPEQRQRVSEGSDIYLTLMTFGQPLQPILMAVGDPARKTYKPENQVARLERLLLLLVRTLLGHGPGMENENLTAIEKELSGDARNYTENG